MKVCSSVNSTSKEMLLSIRCIAIGCNVFFLPVNEWQHFRHEKRARLQSGDVGGDKTDCFRDAVLQRERGERTERGWNMQNNVCVRNKQNKGAATLCFVQWWWGLHMISGETFWSFGLLLVTNAKKKGYISQTVRKEREKKPTKIHNKQAMLLQKTKAPLSQICLNFWQQRKLNNMAFFF